MCNMGISCNASHLVSTHETKPQVQVRVGAVLALRRLGGALADSSAWSGPLELPRIQAWMRPVQRSAATRHVGKDLQF